MPPGGIRTHNLSRRAAADLLLRPRGHWDRLTKYYYVEKMKDYYIGRACSMQRLAEEAYKILV